MDLHAFLTASLWLLIASFLCVVFFRRLGLGSLVGLLVAGILVGPYTPGPVVTYEVAGAREFTELGVVLLLFVIGLEMQPQTLWSMRRLLLGLGLLQVVLTGLAIAGLMMLVSSVDWALALVVGAALALSSTAFVIQLLQERGELGSEHGRASFAVLLTQDLAVVPLLALIALLAPGAAEVDDTPFWADALMVIAQIGGIVLVGRFVLPWVLDQVSRQANREAFTTVAMLAVLGAAVLVETAGMSMALGAFLMGMTLSTSRYHYQIEAVIHPFKSLFMSLFFIAVGMSIDVDSFLAAPWEPLLLVPMIISVKAAILYGLCRFLKISRPASVRTAFMMSQSGEFGFVMFSAALAAGLMGEAAFVLGLLVISVSMLLTPVLAGIGEKLAKGLEKPTAARVRDAVTPVAGAGKRVIVVGYGRVGRTISRILTSHGEDFVALDISPENVVTGSREGHPVYMGDATRPELLTAARAEDARLMIITTREPNTTELIVSHMQQRCPDVPIVVRAFDLDSYRRLRGRGVAHVLPLAEEASMQLAGEALRLLGRDDEEIERLIHACRQEDYRQLMPTG